MEEVFRDFQIVDDGYRKHPESEIVIPQRGDEGSAGYDIRIPCEVRIAPHSASDLVFTDIRAYMQQNEILLLFVRSSIGCKRGLMLCNNTGVIDSSYYNADNEGNIGVKFYNTTDKEVVLEAGERVIQGIFFKYLTTDSDAPKDGKRTGGLGHSGKK